MSIEDFCLPDLLVWYPEAEWPRFYPDGIPSCKFHGRTDCVKRHAWMQYPRRGHGRTRNTAVLSRIYYCSERKNAGTNPHSRLCQDEMENGWI